jgi:hypothetical protein
MPDTPHAQLRGQASLQQDQRKALFFAGKPPTESAQIPVGAYEQREAAIGCAAVVNPFSESVAGETADQQLPGF